MSTATLPYPQTTSQPLKREQSATFVEQAAVFLVGIMLPAIAVSPWGFSRFGLSRATMVDVAVLIALVVMLAGGKLQISRTAIFYLVAITFALVIGLAFSNNSALVLAAVIGYISLGMALLYYVLGASLGRSRGLVKAMMLGFMAGVLWEGVIVLHDMTFPSQWFPEADSRRTRGTFRNGGQLAIYGYAVMGMTLCYGWPLWKSRAMRLIVFACAGFGFIFIVAGSRRSAMAALLVWLALYFAIGFRGTMKKVYPFIVALTVGVGFLLYSNWGEFSKTYVGNRIDRAYQQVINGESTFQIQFWSAVDTIEQWFPLGSGWGRGNLMTGGLLEEAQRWEIHNGHLNLIVEGGLICLVAFYCMVGGALLHKFHNDFGPSTRAVKVIVFTFILSCMVFMIHNRLHRERGFMLLLGITSTLALATPGERGSAPGGQLMQRVLIVRRNSPTKLEDQGNE